MPRLVGCQGFDAATTLRQFYTQPLLAAVRQRVILKIAVLAEIMRPWRCSVPYILQLCIPVESVLGRPRFRSASIGSIEPQECRTSAVQRTTHSGRRISLPPDRAPEWQQAVNERFQTQTELECGPMPDVMVALPNIGGALCSTPQSLADAHY